MKTSIVRSPWSVLPRVWRLGARDWRTLPAQPDPNAQPRVPSSERGVSLILVMLSLMVLSVLAAAIVFTARSETLASYNWKLDTQADYLAKAGIQFGANWLRGNRYQAVPATGTVSSYYTVTQSGGTYNTWTSNVSPVQCVGTTNCSAGQPIALISIPNSTLSTNFPTSAVTTAVITNFQTDFPSGGVRISGSALDSGVVYVNMVLLNYQTVEQGNPPTLTPYPLETWQITSRAYWTGTSGGSLFGTNPYQNAVAVAEEQAVIQPIYVPTWSNAMYGYCSASMSGSSGTCTDAFNSALGAYANGNVGVASGNCDATTANNVIDAGAGIGANGYVSMTSNPIVSGNVTIGSNPTGGSGCCSGGSCGFQGSTAGVQGQVVSGPYIPPPTTPPFGGAQPFPSNLTAGPSPGSGTNTYPQNCTFLSTITPANKLGGTLTFGTTYYYIVTAVFSTWLPTGVSSTASGTLLTAPVESSETEQSVQVTAGNDAVTLTWPALTGASKYHVYRGASSHLENVFYETTNTTLTDLGTKTNDSPAISIQCVSGAYPACTAPSLGTSPPNGLPQWPGATIEPLAAASTSSGGGSLGQPQFYVVTALGAWGESLGVETAGVTWTGGGSKKIGVSWSTMAGATGYRIYRTPTAGGSSGGETGFIYVAGGGTISYTDDGTAALTAGTPPVNPWNVYSAGTGANPPFIGCTAPCVAGSMCMGTETNPFEINSVSMAGSDVLQLIGGKDILHPVYYDIYSFSEAGKAGMYISGYVVLNIQNSFSITGNGVGDPIDYQTLYGVAVNVPPECVQLNYAGSGAVKLSGNGAICALITAPNASVDLKGGGSGGYMVGSIRALNVSMSGGYPLHYDVQLSKAGGVVGTMATTAYTRKKM